MMSSEEKRESYHLKLSPKFINVFNSVGEKEIKIRLHFALF